MTERNIIKNMNELKNEIKYTKFTYKDDFKHICYLVPNDKEECLDFISKDDKLINERGLVYIFVLDGKIFKIGHSIRSIRDRVRNYNGAKASGSTNYFVLQSLLKLGKTTKVYAYFPKKLKYKIFNKEGTDSFPSVKVLEKNILKDFRKKYSKLPIGCKTM